MTEIFNHEDMFREISTDFMNQSTSDSGAGFNQFNFLENGGSIVPTNEMEINNQNGRILFQSDFQSGVDTFNRFHLVYDGALVLPGIVNAGSGSASFGQLGPANPQSGSVTSNISFLGASDTNQWVLQSQNVIKPGNNEVDYFFFCGRFLDENHVKEEISFETRIVAGPPLTFPQAQWNIDVLDGTGSASNPSGIELDLTKYNVFTVQVNYNDCGNIKFGFFIGNKIVFVHELISANALFSPNTQNGSPLRYEGGLDTSGDSILKIGVFRGQGVDETGYFLKIRQSQNVFNNCASFIQSINAFSVGSNRNDYHRTFANGNGTSLVTVGAVRIPIVSIRPKQFFPPPLPPSIEDFPNVAITSLKEIKVSGTSVDLNFGVFIEVVFNQGTSLLTGESFSVNDVNSCVEIDTASNAISAGGSQIYRKTIYPNEGTLDLTIKRSDLLGNFMNQYSHTNVSADGGTDENITPEISIVATSITGNNVDISAEFVWAERP